MKKPRKLSPAAIKKKMSAEFASRTSEANGKFQFPVWEVFKCILKTDERINPDFPDLLVRNNDYFQKCAITTLTMLAQIRTLSEKEALNTKLNIGMDLILEKHGEKAVRLPLFSTKEKKDNRVAFRRGCQLITGLKDPRDAERRFLFALQHIFILKRKDFEHYRDRGFTMAEVLEGRSELGKIPKNKIRKPYERTGNHRRNRQGRKKNPKK